MKNYKILENRPELTNEQIIQGMDFNKIKNNAALAKAALLKSLVIKGLLGTVIISSIVYIYKNNEPSITERAQVISADTANIISPAENDSSAIYTGIIIDKKPATVVKYKTAPDNNTVEVAPLPTDTDTIDLATVYNRSVKESGNAFKGYIFPSDEEIQNSFTSAFGQVDIKEINKSLAKINDRLYASKYEVSNNLYMTFLNSLKQSGNIDLLAIAQIDTLKWTDALSFNEPYVRYYHAHPAYHNYPVVNVSYEGAGLFCEWLTLQYNADPKRKFKKVFFRLPSEEEWMTAARAGDTSAIYSWEGKELRNKKGYMMSNFKRGEGDTMGVAGKLNDNADITAPVFSYWKNNFGLYNMSGNVAEMVNEKGIAKGGSWRDNPESLKIAATYTYDGKAQPFVGFRYFTEIIEE